ncbi:MAG: putative ABC transporter ATP-binding protein YbhF [Firmicutes bacterium ADurb.Bin456]|nr:MAG: putative ABC transporter ATP-binding protein YbhF [Firmicutes bacterium ADurb.Bin456]
MEPVVRVTDLVQNKDGTKILDGISLEVYRGELFGLFGPRGAGKTALLHILAGIDRFQRGSLEILGCDPRKSEKFKHRLGLVTQEKSLFQDLKAGENLDFLAALKNTGRESCYKVIDQFKLTDYLNLPVTRLSAGVYQRLALACALLNEPELLLADELFPGIDPHSHHIIAVELKKYLAGGGTCIQSFNNMDAFARQDCGSGDESCEMKGDESGRINRVGWLEQGQLTIYQPCEAAAEWQRRVKSFHGQSGGDHA